MKATIGMLCAVLMSGSLAAQQNNLRSSLEIFDITTDNRKVIMVEDAHFEAPNWSRDGEYFIINQKGKLYKISMDGKSKDNIPIDNLGKMNNDHGISFDGKTLAVSNNDDIEGTESNGSRIYTTSILGGKPKLITPQYVSYWHGWSPDGKYLVYTAQRNDNFDIYRIPSKGGKEKRLTYSPALDDGPEYSPDGKYIYYNTVESGSMEIWRMRADGKQKEQLTDDTYSNWFAHPSPDGRHFVFISYLDDQGNNHPAMKEVALRLYTFEDGSIRTLCTFTGGQGTINVPSWSQDSKRFAFVTYEAIGNGSK